MNSRCVDEINKLLAPGETGSIWITDDELWAVCDWLLVTNSQSHLNRKNMRFYKGDRIIDTENGHELKKCPLGTFLGASVFKDYGMTVERKVPYCKYIDDRKLSGDMIDLVPSYLVVTKPVLAIPWDWGAFRLSEGLDHENPFM